GRAANHDRIAPVRLIHAAAVARDGVDDPLPSRRRERWPRGGKRSVAKIEAEVAPRGIAGRIRAAQHARRRRGEDGWRGEQLVRRGRRRSGERRERRAERGLELLVD